MKLCECELLLVSLHLGLGGFKVLLESERSRHGCSVSVTLAEGGSLCATTQGRKWKSQPCLLEAQRKSRLAAPVRCTGITVCFHRQMKDRSDRVSRSGGFVYKNGDCY